MTNLELDARLRKDCFIMGAWDNSLLLLLNNSLVPWFIIVPKTQVEELYQLPIEQMHDVQYQINLMSTFLKQQLLVDKLNVAAIGNIVKQLHIHVIGRTVGDYCWPNVVWGVEDKVPYQSVEVSDLAKKLQDGLDERFQLIFEK